MFSEGKPLFLYAESPLHAGSGSSVGAIDLPIQREKSTGFPIIQASGLKGCLRETADWMVKENALTRQELEAVFGPEPESAAEHRGALSVTDARVLLFPVRSLAGVFAWITCPTVLARFKRDLETVGELVEWEPPQDITSSSAWVSRKQQSSVVVNNKVVLEEFTFDAKPNDVVDQVSDYLADKCLPLDDSYAFFQGKMATSLVLLSDNDFRDFVTLSTDVITRICIDHDTGTVKTGALWYEEHLPSETLLYSLALATKPFKNGKNGNGQSSLQDANSVLGKLVSLADTFPRIQIGGDGTVGRGIVRLHIGEGGKA